MFNLSKRYYIALVCLFCVLIPAFILKDNVIAYSVSGASFGSSGSGSNECTSKLGSSTVFSMSFNLDGKYYNTDNCCCASPGLQYYATDNWNFNSNYNGATASDYGSYILVRFYQNKSSQVVQDIGCLVKKPEAPEIPNPRSEDKSVRKTEIYRSENFTVDASTSLVSVNGADSRATNRSGLIMGSNDFCGNQSNYYEANSDKATANFLHNLWHPDTNFNVNVSYTAGASRGSTTVQKNGVRSNVNGAETNAIPLSTSDSATQVCQNINYNVKNWRYNYLREISYTEHCTWTDYYKNGVYTRSSEKTCQEIPGTRTYGNPYPDSSSLSGSGNGSTNNACAMIHRPWNFNIAITDNTTSGGGGETYNGEEILYIGDTITPKYKIDVTKNDSSFPITDIPNATVTLCSGVKGREACSNVHVNKTIHEESGNIDSSTSYSYREKTNYSTYINGENVLIDDVPAGTEYCVEIRVTPTNSGNGYNCGFNKGAATSKKCYIVAKKPTVQVWGGNVVSGGSIKSGFTKKSHGIYGSWDELAIVAGGQITGFASGASLANGGAKDITNNKLTMLTLANSSLVSYLGGDFSANLSKIRRDKEAVLEKIETSYDRLKALPDSPVSGKQYLKVEGNLLIDKNISYVENATTLDSMPKLFIYATGNINIRCDVTRIDAIIVADGTINTCTDNNGATPGRDTGVRSKQLVINGMVIANELQFNRMYGAAAGEQVCVSSRGDRDKCSAVPAEIVNYDSLIELMTMEKVNEGKTGFNVVYTQESAVRYKGRQIIKRIAD